jgi:septum formation protein
VLILASASPRRRALLAELGVAFEVCPSPRDEPELPPVGLAPEEWACQLAEFKARTVAELHPGRWVLGADTLVACGAEILNKPRDLVDARRMLIAQAGRETRVITGVCLLSTKAEPPVFRDAVVSKVWLRDDPAEREAYLATGDWAGKAGAYGIQSVGDRLVARLEGSFNNVVGLPVERLRSVLAAHGLCDPPATPGQMRPDPTGGRPDG